MKIKLKKSTHEKVNIFLKKLKEIPDNDKVKFVILFGSHAQGKENKLSDIDFAVYLDGNKDLRYDFRKNILGELPEDFDVQCFQDLPLNILINVLKGKIIYCTDEDFLYDTYYNTIKRFEDFKKYYYNYIEERRTNNVA